MNSYIKEIEDRLGNYKILPNNPFYLDYNYAVFPALDDCLVDKVLYDVLFDANKIIGNSRFIANAVLAFIGQIPNYISQEVNDWNEFDSFQNSDLVYKGFYLTGDNLNWLGIYHSDDYVIIGADSEFINYVCNKIYKGSNWQIEFEKAYKNGRINMYKDDYEKLKDNLFGKGG